MTHRVVYIFLALVSATLLKAQLSGNGQQSFILGCVVTTGMICAPGSTVTPTSALVNQTLVTPAVEIARRHRQIDQQNRVNV